jgi:hypothetical protein
MAGDDCHAEVTTGEEGFAVIESETAAGPFRAVTSNATTLEKGEDVRGKGDGLRCGIGEAGEVGSGLGDGGQPGSEREQSEQRKAMTARGGRAGRTGERRERHHGVESVEEFGLEMGAMDGGMAAGGPAGAEGEEGAMIDLADPDAVAGGDLGVAFQAEMGIGFGEEFTVDGAVGLVAGGAAFAEGFVLEDKGAGLIAMAGDALFIDPGHGEAAGRLEDLATVGVMAIHAIEVAFGDGVMGGEPELEGDIDMAGEAGLGIAAGVDDEAGAIAGGVDVEAAGAVAGFATGAAGEVEMVDMNAEMDAGLERRRVVGMAIETLLVTDEGGAGDGGGGEGCAGH